MNQSSKANRGSKPLTSEDRKLWEQIRKTVSPLRPGQEPTLDEELAKTGDLKTKPRPQPDNAVKERQASQTRRVTPSPVISGLDRRQSRKFTRGNVEIEARLDLHGYSVERARGALLSFVSSCRDRGLRNVLVITGKGSSPFSRHTLHSRDVHQLPERTGKLRLEVPRWLHEPDFSFHVVGFQPAHPRHGGGGAIYLRLRRKTGRGP
jgi:DNA-nicking Smr family endonuclease